MIDAGLSPLARGTLGSRRSRPYSNRFIPAGAGNTRGAVSKINKPAVYPRWRGEHFLAVILRCGAVGLSPLARGTHPVIKCRWVRERFIPAGAGNTRRPAWPQPDLPVYPRWRGEHADPSEVADFIGGLSPLARGTRFHNISGELVRRFIPAGAGNTCLPLIKSVQVAVYPRWRGEHV